MSTLLETFSSTAILQPAQRPEDARQDAVAFGPSLTVARGTALGIKTSDKRAYPLNVSASDGTQTFVGFSMYSIMTDASNKVFFQTSGTAAAGYRTAPWSTAPIWIRGIFDPQELTTAASSGTPTPEVNTFTPANVTTGDIDIITLPNGSEVTFTVGGTQTAAAAVTGLTAAWNANPVAAALATASGTSTFILTAKAPGAPLNLTSSVIGTGTLAKVVTTPANSAVRGEVDTFTPTNPTTADVYTLTATFPDTTTRAVSFTVGATQTAAATSAGLIAAWNADSILSALAVASGTSTVVLTAANLGTALSVAGTTVGTGTISKVTTTPAAGRSLADILPGAPGARVLHNGFWLIP